MKLTQRINVILLPVIAGIFIVTTLILNATTENQARLAYEDQLEQAVNNISFRLSYETNLADALFSQTISSHEYANYISDPSSYISCNFLEAFLDRERENIRKFMPGLMSVQIITAKGEVLFSADDGDIFEDPVIPPIAQHHKHWLDKEKESIKESFLFKTASGILQLGRLNSFSSKQLSRSSRKYNQENKILYFLTVLNVDYLRIGTPILQRQFLNDFSIQLNINEDTHNSNVVENITIDKSHPYLLASFTHPIFDTKIKVNSTFIDKKLNKQKNQQWLLAVALILFSYLFLLLLINRQIINPILKLTRQIRVGKMSITKELKGGDEVSELNNSYVKLINKVEKLALYDPLTNLANRENFRNYFSRILSRSIDKNKRVALLYIDLDNFKQVNDHYGHDVGDQLLIEFSNRLTNSLRTTDICSMGYDNKAVARLAGDEFSVLLADTSPESANLVVERVLGLFNNGFKLGETKHNIKASIGIAMTPEDGNNVSELMMHADAAMYHAKAAGRNCYQFFTQEIADTMKHKLDIKKEIEFALDNDQFHLVYMPIFEAHTLRSSGVEVLLRSTNSLLSQCGPDKFIPVAESTGLIKRIDLWVIEQSFIKINDFKNRINYQGDFSINMSAVELHNKDFSKKLEALFKIYKINPKKINLEVTETSLVAHDKDSIQTLNNLKSLGISISLDDFGTGYTAFNQLINYPVDCLKIDRSFVNALYSKDKKGEVMLNIIVQMAKLYGLKTTAEGIETQEQLDHLINLDCNYLQGFYLSKPISEIEFIRLLEQQLHDFS